jgi:hypothetical protein
LILFPPFSDDDFFKFLSKSFSLPNLTFTPLESLLPTSDELLGKCIDDNYSDDFEIVTAANSPIKSFEDTNEMWHDGLGKIIPPDSGTNIFSYLECQRATLEERIGVNTLLKVYKMISKLEQSEDERIDYSDLTRVLGKGNEELIDDIIQLVVADTFFH